MAGLRTCGDLPLAAEPRPPRLLISASRSASGTTRGPGGTQVAGTFPAGGLWSSARYMGNPPSPTNSSNPSQKDNLLPNSNQRNVLYINCVVNK